jgi:hypothetical protein
MNLRQKGSQTVQPMMLLQAPQRLRQHLQTMMKKQLELLFQEVQLKQQFRRQTLQAVS